MKRRRRKPNSRQDAKAAGRVATQDATRAESQNPRASVAISHEPTNHGNPAEIQAETGNAPNYVEMQGETQNLASAVLTSTDTEEPAAASPPAPMADRRTHPRYAFTAAVEVVTAEPGARIKTRLRDLSQQGCYVDTDSPLPLGTAVEALITKGAKSLEARARVVSNQPGKGMGLMFTAVPQEHYGTLDTWIAESRETSWLAANRRRSQRVLMKIPVRVSVQAGAASLFEEETHTLAISVHGTLMVLSAPVYRGQRLTLFNFQTKEALECVVAHVDKTPEGQFHAGVEFLLPNPTFWRVAFPPKDWTPRHPHAKSKS